jgi:CheY-like chemotaxis protein
MAAGEQTMSVESPRVVAVMSDLFFAAKVRDEAQKLGMATVIVNDQAAALEHVKSGAAVAILDLNCASSDPLSLIAKIKSDPETAGVGIIGFVSHVQTELRQKASDCGCDRVVARSVFARDLAELLKRFAPAPAVREAH